MAMPSELPPAPAPPPAVRLVEAPAQALLPAECLPLAEAAVALATQMSKSVKCGIGDVFRRVKSRNWMVGQLGPKFPGFGAEDIHDVLDELRKLHRPTSPDQLQEIRSSLTNRRPQKGLEASAFPVWPARAEQLALLVTHPMTMAELEMRGRDRYRWTENFTTQVVAAAEDADWVWWDRYSLYWQRLPERLVMADKAKKVKTVRVQRRLPVELGPGDRDALGGRIKDIDAEIEGIEDEIRGLRARIRDREQAREGVIAAVKNGRELRTVECDERWDYAQKRVVTVRIDTGAEVASREMTQDELQVPMPEAAAS